MIDLRINKEGLKHNIEKAKENHIIIPTIAQMQNPDLIPEKIKEKLTHTGLWDVDPVNLFRISWHNEAKEFGGLYQHTPNYVEIPSSLSGVPCRILAYNLEDEPTNQTRFVVIGPKPTDTSAANKTSILFTLPDKPGSLAGILDLLFKAGVNLRKLESRPLRSQSWKYAFFADLETNLLKPELSGVLAELRNTCHSFRLLGCYTAGE